MLIQRRLRIARIAAARAQAVTLDSRLSL